MENEMLNRKLELTSHISELGRLAGFIELLDTEWTLPTGLGPRLNLVLEEAITNIINYGFVDAAVHIISLEFSRTTERLQVQISDDGKAFDPTAASEPDINLPVEDRPVGGLGILLVKSFMDKVAYRRENDMNILTLIKFL